MVTRINKLYDVCPICNGRNINSKGNTDSRKPQTAKDRYIEPLTCNDCGAAVTRYYKIKGQNKYVNTMNLDYLITTGITVNEVFV